MTEELLWTVDDIARFLRLRTETVRAMARRGEIPALQVGRLWRFEPGQVKSWLGQREKKAEAENTAAPAGYAQG